MRIAHLSLAVFATLAACSSSSGSNEPSAPASTDPFVGSWTCTGTSSTTFTQPPGTPSTSDGTAATVVITDDGKGNLTTVRDPEDAGPPCTLRSTLGSDGKSTTLGAGQTCETKNGGTVTYQTGGSTMNADGTYSSSSTWTFSGMTAKGEPLVGNGTGTSTCKKS